MARDVAATRRRRPSPRTDVHGDVHGDLRRGSGLRAGGRVQRLALSAVPASAPARDGQGAGELSGREDGSAGRHQRD